MIQGTYPAHSNSEPEIRSPLSMLSRAGVKRRAGRDLDSNNFYTCAHPPRSVDKVRQQFFICIVLLQNFSHTKRVMTHDSCDIKRILRECFVEGSLRSESWWACRSLPSVVPNRGASLRSKQMHGPKASAKRAYANECIDTRDLAVDWRTASTLPRRSTGQWIGGKKVYTKGVFSSENSSASTGKKGLVYTKKLVFKGKTRKIHIHQRAFKVVVGGPLRAALVYRFWPPKWRGQKRVHGMVPLSLSSLSWSWRNRLSAEKGTAHQNFTSNTVVSLQMHITTSDYWKCHGCGGLALVGQMPGISLDTIVLITPKCCCLLSRGRTWDIRTQWSNVLKTIAGIANRNVKSEFHVSFLMRFAAKRKLQCWMQENVAKGSHQHMGSGALRTQEPWCFLRSSKLTNNSQTISRDGFWTPWHRTPVSPKKRSEKLQKTVDDQIFWTFRKCLTFGWSFRGSRALFERLSETSRGLGPWALWWPGRSQQESFQSWVHRACVSAARLCILL